MELIVDGSLGGGAWFTGNRIAPHPVPQNGVHVAHDYANGGVRACRLGVRASARVTEALAAVRDMRDIYIYMYIGVGEPQWQVGPRVVIWIAVEYPRWCSLAKIGRLDIKRGCIFFFKLFIELDDFRKIANRHFSSFRIPIFIDDWMIYKTKVLNLNNCIDILKFLFSKRNLLIDNGGVEFWESKKPPPKVSQRRAHPIAPNRAWPLSGSCSTPSVANNSPKMKRIERGHDRKVQSTLYTRRTRHIAPSSPTIIYEAGFSFPSPGSSIAIIVAHPLWSVPRPRARAPCT